MKAHRIVILGGGFGGLTAALQLERRCARLGRCEIILVDERSEHVYTPLLYEVASGFLQEGGKLCRGTLKGGVCVSFEQYREIIGSRLIQFVCGEVVGLESSLKHVLLKDGRTVSYDDLVIALGSQTNDYGIKGVAQHAFMLKNLHDAYRLRARIHTFLERYRDGIEEKITIVVAGAGATGTELSGELGNFFSRLTHEEVIKRKAWSVRLVEAGSNILSLFPPGVQTQACARLAHLGVSVLVNTKIDEVMEDEIVLVSDHSRTKSEADVVVWCGGIKPNEVFQALRVPLLPKGHIEVDPFLRVKGYEELFALGDATALAAPLAQVAIHQAATLAENLVRHVEGRPLIVWRSKTSWPAIIPVGGKWAIAALGSRVFSGRLGYVARKFADAHYLMRILPFKEAVRVWWRGARTYLQND